MNADLEHNLRLMQALNDRMTRLPAEIRAFNRTWRKAQRFDLARAKRGARALRHVLIRVAGHHLAISSEHVERWIDVYLTFCTRLRVVPPIVPVPRSMQHKFGKTIGGPKPLSWDDPLPFDLYQVAIKASSDTILSVKEAP